uniref:THO complex subunit 2 N-terminal domain-containing protein n=1 Tax=Panagrolaimus davidi TaxID=227884 RepID=A0A914Q912_9BILA
MSDCEKLIEKLDAALSKNSPEEFSETFGDDVGIVNDVFSIFDTTLEDGQPDYKKGLKTLATKYFPEEFCHYEYVASGAEDKATKTRMVKLKTRLYYKQLKFNLLREESEGYAKAIAELFSGDKYNDPQRTLSRLQKLIGQFNLDPNRVIDILLDCFEANSERANFYTGILSALKVSRQDLADILKRKFIFQEKLDGSAYSLCNLAAIICEQGLVELLPFFAFVSYLLILKTLKYLF